MPLPENVAVAPLRKCEPAIAIVWLLAPCTRALGLAEETVGFEIAETALVALVAVHECQTAVTV